MFDIAPSELLLTAVVAIVVIGPKDLPRALRLAGSWLAKIRRVSGHFRSGIEEMIRQAELEEMEKKWREKNEAIMREEAAAHTPALPEPAPAEAASPAPQTGAHTPPPVDLLPEPASQPAPQPIVDHAAPELPFGQPKGQA